MTAAERPVVTQPARRGTPRRRTAPATTGAATAPTCRPSPPGSASLSSRDRALLRAVANGRAELVCSCEPDLFIDGLCCCDQYAAHALAREGLIRPVTTGAVGQRVPAELTAAGAAILQAAAHPGDTP